MQTPAEQNVFPTVFFLSKGNKPTISFPTLLGLEDETESDSYFKLLDCKPLDKLQEADVCDLL